MITADETTLPLFDDNLMLSVSSHPASRPLLPEPGVVDDNLCLADHPCVVSTTSMLPGKLGTILFVTVVVIDRWDENNQQQKLMEKIFVVGPRMGLIKAVYSICPANCQDDIRWCQQSITQTCLATMSNVLTPVHCGLMIASCTPLPGNTSTLLISVIPGCPRNVKFLSHEGFPVNKWWLNMTEMFLFFLWLNFCCQRNPCNFEFVFPVSFWQAVYY